MLLKKANTITTPTAYSDGFLHSVKPEVVENLLLQSNQFDITPWSINGTATLTSGQSGYDGSNDAWLLTKSAASTYIGQPTTLSTVNTFSVYAKAGTNTHLAFWIRNANQGKYFDLVNGVIESDFVGTPIDAKIESVGNGWYRCSVTTNDASNNCRIYPADADGDVSGTSGSIYIQDAQLNKGLTADQYLETTTEAKPSADFTFTRNSSATRVNELGYIEDVQIIGGELVSNGDFEQIGSELVTNGGFDTNSNWTLSSGITYNANGYIDFDGTQGSGNARNTPNITFVAGRIYKVVYEIKNYVSGQIRFRFQNGTNTIGQQQSGDGVKIEYKTCNDSANNNFQFFNSPDFIGSIDNVSVKEVGQDWTVTNTDATHYVEFSEQGARFVADTTSPILTLGQGISLTSGTKYRFSIRLRNNGGTGNIKVQATGLEFIPNILDGTYTQDVVPTTNQSLVSFYRNGADVDLYIESFSIKEVTDDTNLPRINYEGFTYAESLGDNVVVNGTFDTDSNWTLGTGWSIGGGVASFDGGADAAIQQSGIISNSVKYRLSLDVLNKTTGSLQIRFGNTGIVDETITTNGTFTYDIISDGTTLYFRSIGGFDGSIDNISVQEVIGDLPVPYSGKGHLLLEPQRTNLAPYSENASNYTTSGTGTVTDNAETSPEGVDNAFELDDTSSGAYFRIEDNITLTAADHTLSVFVKKTSGTLSHYAGLQLDSARKYVILDTTNGTYNETSGTDNDSINIEDFSGDWWRVIITNSVTAGSKRIALWPAISENGTSIVTSATGSNVFYGIQLEEGSYATSYIPTNGTSVTRLGETCNNATQSFPSEGVLYAEIAALADDGSLRRIYISDGSSSDRIMISYNTGSNFIRCFVIAGGVISCDFQTALTNILDFHKIAIRYKENDFSLWIDGEQLATDVSGSVPTGLNDLAFDALGLYNFYGKTKMVATFPYLSNDEMECLTGEGYGTFEALAAAYSYTIK